MWCDGYRAGATIGDDVVSCGDENGRGTPTDDPTTTIDVIVEDDTAATDDDEDDNVLHGFDDEPAAAIDDHKQHDGISDGVSLRIDDSDVVEPPCKPG